MRRGALLAVAVVLGAGCTGDRPPAGAEDGSSPSPPELTRCEAGPGEPPEGFALDRTREFQYADHVGVREDYLHADGRLIVFLLGVTGEMGEGSTVEEELELANGEPATLFGQADGSNWSLVWTDEPPCPQIAVVGNGFTRDEFVETMRESGVLADPS